MPVFSPDEINLIYIFNGGVREWVIADLKEFLLSSGSEDAELRVLIEGALEKLENMRGIHRRCGLSQIQWRPSR